MWKRDRPPPVKIITITCRLVLSLSAWANHVVVCKDSPVINNASVPFFLLLLSFFLSDIATRPIGSSDSTGRGRGRGSVGGSPDASEFLHTLPLVPCLPMHHSPSFTAHSDRQLTRFSARVCVPTNGTICYATTYGWLARLEPGEKGVCLVPCNATRSATTFSSSKVDFETVF